MTGIDMLSTTGAGAYFDDDWGSEDLAIIDALEEKALKRSRSAISRSPNEKRLDDYRHPREPHWVGGSSIASTSTYESGVGGVYHGASCFYQEKSGAQSRNHFDGVFFYIIV